MPHQHYSQSEQAIIDNEIRNLQQKKAIISCGHEEGEVLRVLSYVPYDHRRLLFLTSDSESSCSKSEEKSTFSFSFVVKNPPLWIKNAD